MDGTVIRTDDGLVTLITIFDVAPESQHELVALLNEGAERVFRHHPGFVSANILVAADGGRVVNYAQWRSQEALQKLAEDPAAQEYMKRTAALGTPSPGVYSVASVFHAP